MVGEPLDRRAPIGTHEHAPEDRPEAVATRVLSPMHQAHLQSQKEVDVAWQAPNVGRIRASVFRQRGTIAISMRLIPEQIPSPESLGLPQSVINLTSESRGLILVTGATGSGKSTTLASLVDTINRERAEHILTIEDPIEFVHADQKAVVTQREVGFDTLEYSNVAFPRARFEAELVAELKHFCPSLIEEDGDGLVLRHLYIERRLVPLNIYLQDASREQIERAVNEYGNAIKDLVAANIFPGDMLFKNFGVTRHGKVVFYDYDEIEYITDSNGVERPYTMIWKSSKYLVRAIDKLDFYGSFCLSVTDPSVEKKVVALREACGGAGPVTSGALGLASVSKTNGTSR